MNFFLVLSTILMTSQLLSANVLVQAQNKICSERSFSYSRVAFKALLLDEKSTVLKRSDLTLEEQLKFVDMGRKQHLQQAAIICQWVRENAPVKSQCTADLLIELEGIKFFNMLLDKNATSPQIEPVLLDYITESCRRGGGFKKKVCIQREYLRLAKNNPNWVSGEELSNAVSVNCQ